MSQIAELSENEIEERFLITGKTAIQFMLAGFGRDREAFTVRFGAQHEQFLTTLLDVQADKQRLILDCSGSAETNRGFLNSEKNLFVGRPAGIQVQFSTGPAIDVNYQGAKAFAVSLPKTLLRLQRREHFRIDTPRVKPLQFFGRLPNGELLNLPANDISVSGIGLVAGALPEGLAVGQRLDNCRFSLPEDANDLFLGATVCHLTELEARSGHRQWRVGLRFDPLPPADENRIQRYIVRVEHERRELA